MEQMKEAVRREEGVIDIDDMKTRLFGDKIYVDVEFSADGRKISGREPRYSGARACGDRTGISGSEALYGTRKSVPWTGEQKRKLTGDFSRTASCMKIMADIRSAGEWKMGMEEKTRRKRTRQAGRYC